MSIIDKFKEFMNISYEQNDIDDEDAFESGRKEAKPPKKEVEPEAAEEAEKEPAAKKEPWSGTLGKSPKTEKENSRPKVAVVKGGNKMTSEIVSVHPSSDKETSKIGDYLLDGKTVIINLDGLDRDSAQRIIDFVYGVCYAIHGDLKFPSKYIMIAAPKGVDLSGEFQNGEAAKKTNGYIQTPYDK